MRWLFCVCLCVFRSNYECNVCHSPAHDRVITSAQSAQTSDWRRYFWFPSNLKDKPECRAGFLQRGDAALLHAEEVKYIKGSSAGDLGLGHMLIPCETRRAPFFTPPCKGRFQMEVAKKQKCQDLAFISPVIWNKGNDKNLRRGEKTHTQYLPRSPWALRLFQVFSESSMLISFNKSGTHLISPFQCILIKVSTRHMKVLDHRQMWLWQPYVIKKVAFSYLYSQR